MQVLGEDISKVKGERPCEASGTAGGTGGQAGKKAPDRIEQATASDSSRSSLIIRPTGADGLGPTVSASELQTLGSLPLNAIVLERFVVQEVGEVNVPDRLPVDVSGHPAARTVVAKEMLARLQGDVQGYAARTNGALLPRMRHLTQADFDRLHAAAVSSPPVVDAFVQPALALLQELEGRLHEMDKADRAAAQQAMEAALRLTNESGLTTDPVALLHWMRRYASHRPTLDTTFLIQALMSSRYDADIKAANPFAARVDDALNLLSVSLLLVNRVSHANRAISSLRELCSALKHMSAAAANNAELGTQRAQQAADGLADVLTAGRYYSEWSAEGLLRVDPRFLVFEAVFDLTLRQRQVEMVNWFVANLAQGVSRVQQMIMGAGKVRQRGHGSSSFLLIQYICMMLSAAVLCGCCHLSGRCVD